MKNVPTAYPTDIPAELQDLADKLARLGYEVRECDVDASFGNYAVTFTSLDRSFVIVRDRGQYHVANEKQAELQRAFLWRSFSGINSLSEPLLTWLGTPNAA